MKQLIANLRDQYRQHGTNHVQKAADVIETLIAELAASDQEIEELADGVINCEKQIKELTAERDSFTADAERYQWLRDNSAKWSWNPSRYNSQIISGFAYDGTGYVGYGFEQAVDAAKEEIK